MAVGSRLSAFGQELEAVGAPSARIQRPDLPDVELTADR